MDWTALLRLPTTMLWLLTAGMLLLTVVQLVALRERMQTQPRWVSVAGFALLLVTIVLTVLLAVAGASLRGYHVLNEQTPVAEINARILSPQRWALTLHGSDGSTRQLQLSGDALRMEAVLLRWQPGVFASLPPLYRLERVVGRYDDLAQAAAAPVSLTDADALDVQGLQREYPQWLPTVDAVNDNGVFLPLVDQGHYSLHVMRDGTLVAKPDEATERRLAQPLGE
ncbi:hypothetical protein DVJ77_14410 [Dyella tabacisoli]|uniref:Uncharacterized protein n=2 Tax=Dyella tabacisoli TaxID=2282381 RepID=A0A369UMT8_9GAMM|nr:hypothetical protein DVJ77_14410 [Dyella tabacisoli]